MSTSLFVLLIALISIIALIYLIIMILSTGSSSSRRELQISKKDILEQANLLFKQKK